MPDGLKRLTALLLLIASAAVAAETKSYHFVGIFRPEQAGRKMWDDQLEIKPARSKEEINAIYAEFKARHSKVATKSGDWIGPNQIAIVYEARVKLVGFGETVTRHGIITGRSVAEIEQKLGKYVEDKQRILVGRPVVVFRQGGFARDAGKPLQQAK